jgi:hypothetical protein
MTTTVIGKPSSITGRGAPDASSAGRRGPGAVAAAILAVIAVGCATGDTTAERQAQVAERGAAVMPFDLDATTHVFTETDAGGTQAVTADDPSDQRQIDLIRAHLDEERDKFARGEFDDPARIHGHDMPGVAELTAGHTRVTVTYAELPDGAQLTYESDDEQLIEAIHVWFDRQVMDHGDDAEAG